MKEIKQLSNNELVNEYKAYDQQIHGPNSCFGTKDVMYFYELERELAKRNKV